MSSDIRTETYETYTVELGNVVPDHTIVPEIIKYLFPETSSLTFDSKFVDAPVRVGTMNYTYYGYYTRVRPETEKEFAFGAILRKEREYDSDKDDAIYTMYIYVASGSGEAGEEKYKLSIWAVENNQCNLFNPVAKATQCSLGSESEPILGIVYKDEVKKVYIPRSSTLLVGKPQDIIPNQEMVYDAVSGVGAYAVYGVKQSGNGSSKVRSALKSKKK